MQGLQRELQLHQAQTPLQVLRSGKHRQRGGGRGGKNGERRGRECGGESHSTSGKKFNITKNTLWTIDDKQL